MTELEREDIIGPLKEKLEATGHVLAMWEMGAISFNRIDEWSDIDIILVVEEEKVEDTFEIVENTIKLLTEIEEKFRLPEPNWHGHSQCFFKLKDASPFLLIDMAIIKETADNDWFLQYAIHGKPKVHFDKKRLVKNDPLDIEKTLGQIMARFEEQKKFFKMFQPFVQKELNRKTYADAFMFYMGQTLRPLVEVLRFKYCPVRWSFSLRYAYYDFPEDVAKRLESFVYIKDPETLKAKAEEASQWFWETANQIDEESIRKLLEKQAQS